MSNGVGTRLKMFFARYGIRESSGCRCAELAKKYDDFGVIWCEEHFDEIVEEIRQNAIKRFGVGPRFIIRRIVRNAIKEERS